MYLKGIENMWDICCFGELSELGLLNSDDSILLTLDAKMLAKLPTKFKDETIKLFETYNDVFAKTDTDIGIYNRGAHKIDIGNAKPFLILYNL